jgi:hypothetical protein
VSLGPILSSIKIRLLSLQWNAPKFILEAPLECSTKVQAQLKGFSSPVFGGFRQFTV